MVALVFEIPVPPPPRPREEVHAPAMARGARCDLCPLYGCGEGPIMGEIRPGAAMTVVGEAPGEKELLRLRPFTGWSGDVLNQALNDGGLSRLAATITNTILCRPQAEGGNYKAYIDRLTNDWKRRVRLAQRRGEEPPDPPVFPQSACAPRLSRDIAESGAKVILAVGKQALEACARELNLPQGAARVQPGEPYVAGIAKQHGAPVMVPDGRVLMSSYHPAMAAPGRGRSEYLPLIRENLTRAAWVAARNGFIPWKEPVFRLNPSAVQAIEFCERLRRLNVEVTADIETSSIDTYTTQIRCVGIGARVDDAEEVMVIPFRHMDGSPWWPSNDETIAAALALREVLDKNPLVFQNGSFDTSVLLARGLMTNRHKSWTDTMLLHHDTPDNDLPHDLGFIARRYFCTPMWKSDIDHKSVDNVNDANLHLYNARDVLITHRLVEPLRQQVAAWSTGPQYETDYKLAPVLREMGHVGLVVDEERRGEFSEQLNWQAQRELYQFRECIGKSKFNPRSVPQLQDLIFREWGYLPVLGVDQYEIKRDGTETWQQEMLAEDDAEFEDEELGSTSSGAIIELIKKREMRPEHVRALKILLEYRAYDKLRGTYVDTLRVRPVDWAALGQEVGWLDPVSALVWDPKVDDYVMRELLARRSALSLLNTIYKGHVVPTGRLATQPAVQNWPALGKANMREMVVAPPGHVMVMGDYAQLEARLYAVAARDALLLQAIRDKRDIHSMNAAALLAKNLGEIEYWYRRVEQGEGLQPSERKTYRKYWRTVAKRFAFLEIYGGEEDKLFSVMAQQRNKEDGELSFKDLKRSDVDTWHDNWHRLHPETKRWHAECHAFYEANGYAMVPAIDFRRRYFLGGLSKKNAVPNMTIQGFASSIANQALLRLVARIPFRSWSHWTGVVLQVHDALALYVPNEKEQETRTILDECMYYEKDGVPFPAEIGCATRWSKTE